MWSYDPDTPLWVVALTLVAAMVCGVVLAKYTDEYSQYLDPDTIRWCLGTGGGILAFILLVIGIRKLIS